MTIDSAQWLPGSPLEPVPGTKLRAVKPGEIPNAGAGLPSIYFNNRQLRDVSTEALEALQAANDPPFLFVRSGVMVAVIRDEKQRQVIGDVGESALRGRMTRSANYFKRNAKGEPAEYPPPIEAVKDVLALEPSQWGFQPLDGVVEAPILRPDGSILENPGYDAVTGLYYAPDPNLSIPPIVENPSSDQVAAALQFITSAIGEFPYKDGASWANAIAAFLTPIVKPAINAPAPLALFDAPQAGTGKSLLADVLSIVATGRPGEMFSAPRDEDEWRKQITTALLTGTSVVVIDNVNRKLDNPDLCKVLTETTHADREFRTHHKLVLPVKSTFIATGNNIQIGGDMPRRCYWVRLDAQDSQPFLRTGFKIDDLKGWVTEHRAELLVALLTLARAWYVAECPRPTLKPLGSFESWSITIGGILQHAGVEGFLSNCSNLYAEADSDSVQWEGFFDTLHEVFYGEPFATADIAQKLNDKKWNADEKRTEPTAQAAMLRATLPEFLAEGLGREGFFQRRAGRCFAGMVDQRFGTSQVHLKRGEVVHGAQQWKVMYPRNVKSGS
jgi:hypothetical protein